MRARLLLLLLLSPLLIGCPDSPPPSRHRPSPAPAPSVVVTATSPVAPVTTATRSPEPAPESIVYKTRGDPVRGELLSAEGADPIVIRTAHGRVSIPRALVTYVRRPGDPPPPPDLLEVQSRAGAGDPAAMVSLGTLLELGRGAPADPEGAFRWYRRAALAGHASGMSRLAWAYLRGIGTPVDLDGYRRWIRRAAAAGDPFARAGRAHLKGDAEAARAAYRAAAEADDDRACLKLAEMLERGSGGPRDGAMARVWLDYGARLGNPTCMTRLGERLEPSDRAGALRWYRAAAKQGDPGGLTALGRLYRRGEGVRRDHRRAVALWRRAARTGRKDAAEAMVLLGRALERGRGVKTPDLDQARLWFARAAQHGHPGGAAGLKRLRRRSSR